MPPRTCTTPRRQRLDSGGTCTHRRQVHVPPVRHLAQSPSSVPTTETGSRPLLISKRPSRPMETAPRQSGPRPTTAAFGDATTLPSRIRLHHHPGIPWQQVRMSVGSKHKRTCLHMVWFLPIHVSLLHFPPHPIDGGRWCQVGAGWGNATPGTRQALGGRRHVQADATVRRSPRRVVGRADRRRTGEAHCKVPTHVCVSGALHPEG